MGAHEQPPATGGAHDERGGAAGMLGTRADTVQAIDARRRLEPLLSTWGYLATFALLAGSGVEHWLDRHHRWRFGYAPLPVVVALLLLGVAGVALRCSRTGLQLSPATVFVSAASFVPFFVLDALDTLVSPVRLRSPSLLGIAGEQVAPSGWIVIALKGLFWVGAMVGMQRWLERASRHPLLPPSIDRWHRAAQIHLVAALGLLVWSVVLGVRRPPSEDVWRGVAEMQPASLQASGGMDGLVVPEEGLHLTTRCRGWCHGLSRAGQTATQMAQQTEELGDEVRYSGTLALRRTPDGRAWLLTEQDGPRLLIAAAWRADDLSPITARLHHVTSAIGPSRSATFTLMLGLALATAALALRRAAARRLARIEEGRAGHLSANGSLVLDGGQILRCDSTGTDCAVVVLAPPATSPPFREHSAVSSRDVLPGERAALTDGARTRVALCDATAVAVLILPLASAGTMALGWIP